MKRVTVAILVLCGSLSAWGATQELLDKAQSTLRYARICDPSGCYLAWRVVDSDHDGVSDADELIAGTDPYDPLSKPSLRVVAEMSGKGQLPSFEAGLGAFLVFPEELQAMLDKDQKDPLAAFPLGLERKDSLSRAGISAELLKQNGVDADHDGFTLGFDKPVDSGMPERKVGGIKVSLISADDDLVPLPKLPHEPPVELADGTIFIKYSDGTTRYEYEDGGGVVFDKEGEEINKWYVNPDAEQGSTVTTPTPEQEAAFERLRGAAIRTVEGWSSPTLDGTPTLDKRATVILVDPDYAFNPAMVFDAPEVTTAQPEVRSDLPRPDVPANPDGTNGGCTAGCY